ncbi:hypothetical protein CABS03_13509 [Colletotrichum abscissum]|uniref:Uncharacterized protein n=1 Tax=Colletotrichum abscissum TaxID=1671311 RepID=A0A9P9X7Q1_9PEZI|nr:hypothetical protein CABS02_11574 [Colletotrichum abscissum]
MPKLKQSEIVDVLGERNSVIGVDAKKEASDEGLSEHGHELDNGPRFLDILSQNATHCEVALAWWIKGRHGVCSLSAETVRREVFRDEDLGCWLSHPLSVPRKSVPDGSADTEVFRGQDNRTHSSTE